MQEWEEKYPYDVELYDDSVTEYVVLEKYSRRKRK